jgi:hypothetical protein
MFPAGIYGFVPAKYLLAYALLVFLVVLPNPLASEPVAVRRLEGSFQGFLVLRTQEGKILASGNLTQVVHGTRGVTHLVFRFKDGSLDDEIAVFTEQGSFKLISDRHIQRGPMFPKPMDMEINAVAGKVTVRYKDKGREKVETQKMDLPNDLANGVIINLLKNITPDGKETKLSWVAATPKPRVVKLSITSAGEGPFSVAGLHYNSTRFNIKVEIGGVAGVIAPLVGKEPADTSVWIAQGVAPEFVKLEGALYFGGPIWRIEMASPVW